MSKAQKFLGTLAMFLLILALLITSFQIGIGTLEIRSMDSTRRNMRNIR